MKNSTENLNRIQQLILQHATPSFHLERHPPLTSCRNIFHSTNDLWILLLHHHTHPTDCPARCCIIHPFRNLWHGTGSSLSKKRRSTQRKKLCSYHNTGHHRHLQPCTPSTILRLYLLGTSRNVPFSRCNNHPPWNPCHPAHLLRYGQRRCSKYPEIWKQLQNIHQNSTKS